jgi:hypothetical protein
LFSIPAAAYGLLFLVVQFMQTGADRAGQCEGMERAAAMSGLIPESVVFPSQPAIGCGNERYGIFFSLYNDVTIWGVTNRIDQDRILRILSEYKESKHTLPIRVSFYEKENWKIQAFPRGSEGERGPEKLIRVTTVN